MIDIRCDHKRGYWPLTRQCRAQATKHLLHYPVWGLNPQVLLLCSKHFDHHIARASEVLVQAGRLGHSIQLSALVKDAGNI